MPYQGGQRALEKKRAFPIFREGPLWSWNQRHWENSGVIGKL
jgi:hypothetical protein